MSVAVRADFRPVTVRHYTCESYLRRLWLNVDEPALVDDVEPLRVSVALIQKVVAATLQIPVEEMWSCRRARDVARPRQLAMYLARRFTPLSRSRIGHLFGDRDHTTVLHAERQIERFIAVDPEFAIAVAYIIEQIRQRAEREATIMSSQEEEIHVGPH